MLNKTTLADESVSTLMDMMIWLSAQYGPPIKTPVPKVLKPDQPLQERCWGDEDTRTVFAWAEAEINYLSKLCAMENWSVQVTPNGANTLGRAVDRGRGLEDGPTLTSLQSDAWNSEKYPGYCVDYFGRPTFFYDPRRCAAPGYFAKTVLPQFAMLKIYAQHPPAEFGEDAIEKLIQMTACHMGFGFTLLATAQNGSAQGWSPMEMLGARLPDADEIPFLYGALITMAAHRLTREQILATYGKLMSPRTRKLIGPAYAQINEKSDVLKLLRMLSKPIRTERPVRSHPDPVQASADLG